MYQHMGHPTQTQQQQRQAGMTWPVQLLALKQPLQPGDTWTWLQQRQQVVKVYLLQQLLLDQATLTPLQGQLQRRICSLDWRPLCLAQCQAAASCTWTLQLPVSLTAFLLVLLLRHRLQTHPSTACSQLQAPRLCWGQRSTPSALFLQHQMLCQLNSKLSHQLKLQQVLYPLVLGCLSWCSWVCQRLACWGHQGRCLKLQLL